MQDRQLKCFQGDFKAEKLVLKFVIGWWCWVEVLRSVQRAGAQPARGHWSPGMDGEFLQADRVLTYLTYQPECNCCITHFILFWTSWWKTWGIQLIQKVFFMMLHSSIYLNIKNIHILTIFTIANCCDYPSFHFTCLLPDKFVSWPCRPTSQWTINFGWDTKLQLNWTS